MKILILENNESFAKILKICLEKENHTVEYVNSIEEAENITFNKKFDLYLFDIDLKDGNSLQLLEMLRFAEDNTPTICMTDVDEVSYLRRAFNLGALDYLKKPFNLMELLIRIEAKFKQEICSYKHLEFNPFSNIIKKEGKIIDMGIVPTNVFAKLIDNKGTITLKEELMESLDHPSENALRVVISKLKQRLNIEIKNIRAKGYLLEEF